MTRAVEPWPGKTTQTIDTYSEVVQASAGETQDRRLANLPCPGGRRTLFSPWTRASRYGERTKWRSRNHAHAPSTGDAVVWLTRILGRRRRKFPDASIHFGLSQNGRRHQETFAASLQLRQRGAAMVIGNECNVRYGASNSSSRPLTNTAD